MLVVSITILGAFITSMFAKKIRMATIESQGEPPFLRPPSRPRTAYPRVAACTAAPCRQGEGSLETAGCRRVIRRTTTAVSKKTGILLWET